MLDTLSIFECTVAGSMLLIVRFLFPKFSQQKSRTKWLPVIAVLALTLLMISTIAPQPALGDRVRQLVRVLLQCVFPTALVHLTLMAVDIYSTTSIVALRRFAHFESRRAKLTIVGGVLVALALLVTHALWFDCVSIALSLLAVTHAAMLLINWLARRIALNEHSKMKPRLSMLQRKLDVHCAMIGVAAAIASVCVERDICTLDTALRSSSLTLQVTAIVLFSLLKNE